MICTIFNEVALTFDTRSLCVAFSLTTVSMSQSNSHVLKQQCKQRMSEFNICVIQLFFFFFFLMQIQIQEEKGGLTFSCDRSLMKFIEDKRETARSRPDTL